MKLRGVGRQWPNKKVRLLAKAPEFGRTHHTTLAGLARGKRRRRAAQPPPIVLLNDLAVQCEIETVALHLFADAQADDDVDDLQDDEGDHAVVDNHGYDAEDLVDDLSRIAFDQTSVTAVLIDGEHAGQDRADDAADAVDAEAIQRVVVAEGVLEGGGAEIAADAAGDADHHRADWTDIARSWGDRDEAGDGARADADDRRLAAMGPFNENPGQSRNGRRNLRDCHRHARLHAGADSRTGVEAEPADPEQAGADEGEDHVVAGTRVASLAEHQGGDETCNARVDMHHRAARIIEHHFPTGEIALVVGVRGREHAVRTPDPVRDGGIDADRERPMNHSIA